MQQTNFHLLGSAISTTQPCVHAHTAIMDDGSRLERRNLLATAIWDYKLDDSAEGKLSAYLRWLGREFYGSMHELVFFVDIIRSNMELERSTLSQAVRSLRAQVAGRARMMKSLPLTRDFITPRLRL